MNILLLGATGRTGKLVLKTALEKGYSVHCLVRNPERVEPQTGIQIFDGDPSNSDDLEKAIKECSCIINVLNISRKTDFPWSGLRTPKTFLSDVMSTLIPLAKKQKIKRVVNCSAWGVAETRKNLPFWFRWIIDYSNIGVAYADHERQEKLLEKSSLDWTIIQPVGLTNFKEDIIIRESFENSPKPSLIISRQSVANYMIDSVKNDSLIRRKVVISKG